MCCTRFAAVLAALVLVGTSQVEGLDCKVGSTSTTGGTTTGTLTTATCPNNYLCARTETTASGTTTVVASCQTATACDNLCLGATGCISACCGDAADCNDAAVSAIIETVTCKPSNLSDASAACQANEYCARKDVTSSDGMTVTSSGGCTTTTADNGLCVSDDTSGGKTCVSKSCNYADNCNDQLAVKVGVLSCAVTNGNMEPSTPCTAGQVCAKMSISGGATTASCQAQSACGTLCGNTADCTEACCSDADDCNSGTVAEITANNARLFCMVGTVGTSQTVTHCTANQICGRKEIASGATTTTCQNTAATCDALCASDANCISACCSENNCNRESVATMRNVLTCMTGTVDGGTLSATTTCAAGELCGRTKTGTVIVGSCVTQAACDDLCAGVATCTSACCNDADRCNGRTVAEMKVVLRCASGSTTTGTLPNSVTCGANELCARKETTSGATTTTVGSCQAQAACEALCDGESNCASACCDDGDNCNSLPVKDIINVVRCGTGVNNANSMTCAAGSLCGKTTVSGGDTTGSCSTQAQCDDLCAGTASCTSSCCNDADNCNSRTVVQMAGLLQCASGSVTNGNLAGVVTCAANELCARKETTSGSTTTTVGMCATQDACDLLCTGATGCVSACCNDGDMCNSLSVTDISNVVRCGTGTKTTTSPAAGVFTESATCTAGQLCARKETLTGNSLETIGSCQAQTACATLCASATGCTATCCNDADGCNTLSIPKQNARKCFVGSTTQTSSTNPSYTFEHCASSTDVCSRTETTANNGDVTIVGACQTTVTACDTLCQGTAGCVSACCSEDVCNTESVSTMRNVVTCLTGTSTTGTLTTTTTCQAGELCAKTETTVTSGGTTTVTTVGSCATQAACDLLCTGVTGCVSACCNDVDSCNSQTVTNMDNTLRCASGTVTTGTLTASLTCATGSQCGRKETTVTANDGTATVTTVGSCSTAGDCSNGLCGGVAGCVAACCSDADTCNSLTVAAQTGRVCSVGSTTKVGSAAATGSLVPTHCDANSYCGRQEITSTDANNVATVVTTGSCQASVSTCNLLCAGNTVCVSACCNDNTALCNNDTPANIKNILTCHTGSVTDGTLTGTTTCTAGQMCARKETTASGTTTTEGSCVAQSACATLCGATAGCVSSCCDFADLCNSLTVAQSNALKCYVGSSTAADPISEIAVQLCNTGEQCGRTETTTTSGGTTTTTTVGSCTATSACDNLCGTTANCVSNCCDTSGCNASPVPTTTTTTTAGTTTAAATTTSGSVRTAGINIFFMICVVVFGYIMA